MYAHTQRGLGKCGCRKPLGDAWDTLDSIAANVVDWASFPYNAATGQLTEMQKQALALKGQSEILAVTSSPGAALLTPSQQVAVQSYALSQAAQTAGDQVAVQQLNTINPPSPTNYALLILLGLGALVLVKI
ncbi:MAG: hypothetical protein ACRD20_02270 [Terriglobales bacterium]